MPFFIFRQKLVSGLVPAVLGIALPYIFRYYSKNHSREHI